MDIATIIGVLFGLFLIISAIILRQGGIGLFWNVPSLFITFGGTIAAVLVNYPIKQVFRVFKIASKVVIARISAPLEIIEELLKLARTAKMKGVLALEEEVKNINDPFLKRGIQLIIDGATREHIETELNTEITFMQKRHRIGQEIFITLGTYAPAFGLLGTVTGLILMLANLQEQAQIAAGMAVALLTTFYGLLSAYLIFLPIAGKLKRRSEEEVVIKQVVIQGILSMYAGETSLVMEDKLKAYLEPHLREELVLRKELKKKEEKAKVEKPEKVEEKAKA